MNRVLRDPEATDAFGTELADALRESDGAVIYLRGELGAGKTSLVRALLRGLGVVGSVRSPTYSLVEPYDAAGFRIAHMDLYRLADPEELEFLGIRELNEGRSLLLVEWPDRGQGVLPEPDLDISLEHLEVGRGLSISGASPRGLNLIESLSGAAH